MHNCGTERDHKKKINEEGVTESRFATALNQYRRGNVDKTMMIAVICEKFGWTYYEYMNTPSWLIELIIEKMKIDYEKQNKK